MGFLTTSDGPFLSFRETLDFYDAEMLTVIWETKPEIVQRLLPSPLKPGKKPLAIAIVASYPRTNFGVSYLESGLFIRAEFNGQEGNYCLAMPVTNDIALIFGREVFGFPMKIGDIRLNRRGNEVEGLTERHGLRFLEIRAKLTGFLSTEDAPGILAQIFTIGTTMVLNTFNFKYFPAPEGTGFDYSPRLIREEVEFRHRSLEVGDAEVLLRPSEFDPWAEVEVVRVLGAAYTVGEISMRKGKVMAETDPMAFAPYAMMKLDSGRK
jgi:acetoacetate decarboxylase